MVGVAHAAADITVTQKAIASTAVTITVKNNGTPGIDASGGSYSTVSTTITALNATTTQNDYSATGPNLAGGVSRDVVVTNLKPNTAYTISVRAEEGSTQKTVTLSVKTKTNADQSLPPKPLYVSFVTSETVVTTNTISNVTVKNTGTKDFAAVITLQSALGATIDTQQRVIGAGQTYNLISFTNLSPGTGYILTLTGTEVGSTRRFETATYPGLTTKNVPITALNAIGVVTTTASAPATSGTSGANQCNDSRDNQIGDGKDYGYGVGNGDHKADHYGVDTVLSNGKGDGIIDIEPDPSCFSEAAVVEKGDDVVSNIIPCTDKCTFSDVFRLLNNIIKFFFTTLLIPIFIIMLMYAGYQYITAQGNPSKVANLKKMLGNFAKGLLLILCAWLIVRTIMTTLLNDEFKQSGVELLGN